MQILLIVWNPSQFLTAISKIEKELSGVKITVLDVHMLNDGKISLPNLSIYDGVIIRQMGSGEWEKELQSYAKSFRLFLAFKSKLDSMSSVKQSDYEKLRLYLAYDGAENLANFLKYCLNLLGYKLSVDPPKSFPWHGIYYPGNRVFLNLESFINNYPKKDLKGPYVGLLFYRLRLLFNDLKHIDLLIEALERRGLRVIPVFSNGFPDPNVGAPSVEEAIKKYFIKDGKPIVSAIVWGLFFRVCPLDNGILNEIGVPVINAIEMFVESQEGWLKSDQGISPIEVSMSIALPEFDAAIDPIVFSGVESSEIRLSNFTEPCDLKWHSAIIDRIERIADRVARWCRLKAKRNSEKRVAIILHSSAIGNREGNIGTSLGLDSGQSVIEILKHLRDQGYNVVDIPKDGQALFRMFVEKSQIWPGKWTSINNMRLNSKVKISYQTYTKWFSELPPKVKDKIKRVWGEVPKRDFVIPGFFFGNVFVTVQPPRAPDISPEDVHKIIHDPTLPIPHYYYCFYRFICEQFDVVIHVGKHGNVEWLPGKSAGLSAECFPDVCLRDIPNAYIYIVNNPSEGSQAKRRGYATIIDHLPPPMVSNNRYAELEEAINEYLKAKERKLEMQMEEAKRRIVTLSAQNNFDIDATRFDESIAELHSRIQYLNRSSFNYGLHVFGVPPEQKILDEFLVAVLKPEKLVLEAMGVSYSKYVEDPLLKVDEQPISEIVKIARESCLTLIRSSEIPEHIPRKVKEALANVADEILSKAMDVRSRILSSLEIPSLTGCLDGRYVLPGPSGDMTRGRIDIVPTGRNFYSVDPSAIPTKSSWEVGKKLGEQLLGRFQKEEGRIPETIAFVEWSTDPTNTDGEQIAEILFLLGVKPVWEGDRVVGLSVIPLEELGRPRIDVVVRVGGLFRDMFPKLMELMDEAISIVASLNEPLEMNFVRKHVLTNGIKYRVFGDKPGAYGAGVNHAINASVWKNEDDLAEIYIKWSCYAYGKGFYGVNAEKELRSCLKLVDATVRNHYTDEWDIFDDDCPYAYQGGLTIAAKKESGKSVKAFISDTRNPEIPNVVDISEEIERVARNTLLNQRWLEGMKNHGYKGASDAMKKVVNLFGWSATTRAVKDWIFQKIAETYIFNKENKEWLESVNPYALEEISRRLYEAYKRGLWKASEETIQKLRREWLEIEGLLEASI